MHRLHLLLWWLIWWNYESKEKNMKIYRKNERDAFCSLRLGLTWHHVWIHGISMTSIRHIHARWWQRTLLLHHLLTRVNWNEYGIRIVSIWISKCFHSNRFLDTHHCQSGHLDYLDCSCLDTFDRYFSLHADFDLLDFPSMAYSCCSLHLNCSADCFPIVLLG